MDFKPSDNLYKKMRETQIGLDLGLWTVNSRENLHVEIYSRDFETYRFWYRFKKKKNVTVNSVSG
jgi:hypothetical protein